MYAYNLPHLDGEDIVLSLHWFLHNLAFIEPCGKNAVLRLRHDSAVPAVQDEPKLDVRSISTGSFGDWNRQAKKNLEVRALRRAWQTSRRH